MYALGGRADIATFEARTCLDRCIKPIAVALRVSNTNSRYAIVLVVSLNARAGMGTQSGLIHTALSDDHELAWRVTKTDQEAPRTVHITTAVSCPFLFYLRTI